VSDKKKTSAVPFYIAWFLFRKQRGDKTGLIVKVRDLWSDAKAHLELPENAHEERVNGRWKVWWSPEISKRFVHQNTTFAVGMLRSQETGE